MGDEGNLIVLLPTTRLQEETILMGEPEMVMAAPPAEMVVPSMLKPDGFAATV